MGSASLALVRLSVYLQWWQPDGFRMARLDANLFDACHAGG